MILVTVTCKRDLNQMLLQAESIERFVKNTTHYVIVNDRYVNESFWYNKLSPYYHNNNLKLVFPKWRDLKHSGWHKQIVYKLKIAELLNDDYIILDSKNFFIRDTDLNSFRDIVGSGKIENNIHRKEYDTCNKYIAKCLGVEPLTHFLSSETPFVIKPELVKDNAYREWFNHRNFSECIYYSYLAQSILPAQNQGIKHHTLWDKVTELSQYNELNIFGVHMHVLEKCTDNEISTLNKWIRSKGLITKLYRRTVIDRIKYQIELIINFLFPKY